MALKKCCIIAVVAVMAMVLPAGSTTVVAQEYSPQFSPGLHTGWMVEPPGTWIDANDITFNRTYHYYIPSSYDGSEAVPLLCMFHGLGGNGDMARNNTGFDELADQDRCDGSGTVTPALHRSDQRADCPDRICRGQRPGSGYRRIPDQQSQLPVRQPRRTRTCQGID